MGSNSGGSSSDDVFDVRRVRRLIELMKEFDLAELDLRQSEQRIHLRKDVEPVIIHGSQPAAPAPAFPAPAAAPTASTGAPSPSAEPASAQYVTSPMVGTFYAASSPDSPPFVKVGDQVGPDTVVCIIEAMKVFNEIPAECAGKVSAVLVENGAAVEFGQKLYRVDKSG